MRFLFIFFFLNFHHFTFSQDRYGVFAVNSKYGVVDISDLTQVTEPNYIKYHSPFKDIFCLMTDEYVDIYDKEKGFLKRFHQPRPELIYHKDITYFCYFDEENSYLIPYSYADKIIVPKKYIDLYCNNDYLICKGEDYFDVYRWGNFDKPIVSDIKATKYIFKELKDKYSEDVFNSYCFFGGENTLIYTNDFQSKKTFENVSEIYELEKTLIKNQIVLIDKPWKASDFKPRIPLYVNINDSFEMVVKTENGNQYKMKTNKKYDWRLYDEEKLILYNYERSEYFLFKIDFENKKFLIPKEYQQRIGIKFIE